MMTGAATRPRCPQLQARLLSWEASHRSSPKPTAARLHWPRGGRLADGAEAGGSASLAPPWPKEAGRGDRAIWVAFCRQDGWRTGGGIQDPDTLGRQTEAELMEPAGPGHSRVGPLLRGDTHVNTESYEVTIWGDCASQARTLEGVAISPSRGSFPPRDGTRISCFAGGCSAMKPPGEPRWASGEPQGLHQPCRCWQNQQGMRAGDVPARASLLCSAQEASEQGQP